MRTLATLAGTKMDKACMRLLASALICALCVMMGCSSEDVGANGATPCEFDSECAVGEVCITRDGECGQVDCEFCLDGQVCYTDDAGNSSCSKPECNTSEDCPDGEACSGGLCTENTCQSREDCPDGQICKVLSGVCADPPDMCSLDTDCPAGEICLESGECRPGCTSTEDCPDGEFCDTGARVCAPGCAADTDCAADQSCEDNACACDPDKCDEGFVCDPSGTECVEQTAESCDDVTCPEGEVCNPDTLQCEEETAMGCTMVSCPEGEVCNTSNGQCIPECDNGKSPASCDPMSDTPVFNPDFCECVECVDDTQCDSANGETCNVNFGICQGECPMQDQCDSSQPGSCDNSAGSYCFAECCVECISASDCNQGQICIDGTCGAAPSCAMDPTVCPSGTECINGTCQASMGGQSCDLNDPMSCPFGQVCQPSSEMSTTGTCQPLGGGNPGGGTGGCGGCNSDCTCPGMATCTAGFICTGCSPAPLIPGTQPPPFGPSGDCPNSGLCLEGLCVGSLFQM